MRRGIALLLMTALALVGVPACALAAPAQFHILASEDMRALEPVLQAYIDKESKRGNIQISYEGILDIKRALEAETCVYDAVWLSNSIPLNMLNGGQRIMNSRFIAVTPVVFAVKESRAEQLGWMGELHMADIVNAVKRGDLSFVMPSVTQTNSGLSAYLGILSALCGNPNVLTVQHLRDEALQADLTALFSGVVRSSGSDEYVAELVKQGYDCIVGSEAGVIRLNRELEASGQETMRLLYPVDGVTMADTPFAHVNKGDASKLEEFIKIQSFLLDAQAQEMLAGLGMRTDLGGLIYPEHYEIFREEWGVRSKSYIGTIVYPSKALISQAQKQYQELFRKPAFTVFCLDFSGSMFGEGKDQLMRAMEYILDPALCGGENIQFTDKDRIAIVVFNTSTVGVMTGAGDESLALFSELRTHFATGSTFLHAALLDSLALCEEYDEDAYSISVVMMTDGEATGDKSSQQRLEAAYRRGDTAVPIYSIMFGNASSKQLLPLAELSRGEVFDGRVDLEKTFRQVRGYN